MWRHLGIGADSQNFSRGDCYSLGGQLASVERDDMRIVQNDFGGRSGDGCGDRALEAGLRICRIGRDPTSPEAIYLKATKKGTVPGAQLAFLQG